MVEDGDVFGGFDFILIFYGMVSGCVMEVVIGDFVSGVEVIIVLRNGLGFGQIVLIDVGGFFVFNLMGVGFYEVVVVVFGFLQQCWKGYDVCDVFSYRFIDGFLVVNGEDILGFDFVLIGLVRFSGMVMMNGVFVDGLVQFFEENGYIVNFVFILQVDGGIFDEFVVFGCYYVVVFY